MDDGGAEGRDVRGKDVGRIDELGVGGGGERRRTGTVTDRGRGREVRSCCSSAGRGDVLPREEEENGGVESVERNDTTEEANPPPREEDEERGEEARVGPGDELNEGRADMNCGSAEGKEFEEGRRGGEKEVGWGGLFGCGRSGGGDKGVGMVAADSETSGGREGGGRGEGGEGLHGCEVAQTRVCPECLRSVCSATESQLN